MVPSKFTRFACRKRHILRLPNRALALGALMFVVDNCVAHSPDTVQRYGRAIPVQAEELLLDPTGYRKLAVIYPHFVRQQTDASCSLASVTTLINAARAARRRVPVTQDQVLATDTTGVWRRSVADHLGDGVDLDAMALHVMRAFHSQVSKGVNVDVRRMGRSRLEYTAALQTALAEGESSPAGVFIVVNALQSRLFKDGEPIGHMSVVGAYDARARRVLILDVDNRNPMPYWVSVDALVDGMNTVDDMTGEPRGYLLIHT